MSDKSFRSPKKPVNSKQPNKRRSNFRSVGFVALLILLGLIVAASMNRAPELKPVPFSTVVRDANSDKYDKIVAQGAN